MIEDKIDYKTLFEPLYQKPIKPGIKIEYYIQMEYKPFIAKNIAWFNRLIRKFYKPLFLFSIMAINRKLIYSALGIITLAMLFSECDNKSYKKSMEDRLGNGVEKEEHSIPQYIHEGVDAYIPMPNSYYEKWFDFLLSS